MAKVIIEAAINGNAVKKNNPHIPYSPKESPMTRSRVAKPVRR